MVMFSAMRTLVIAPGRDSRTAAPRARLASGWRASRLASATQVGQWCPTGAGCMHAGQIGRPHRVQWTRVSSLGWR